MDTTTERKPHTLSRMGVYLLTDPGDPECTETVEHIVVVRHADRLRAESLAKGLGLASASIAEQVWKWQGLWAWCALTRLGLYKGKFQVFENELAEIDPDIDTDDKGQPVAAPVEADVPGPTTPAAPEGSPSP